jgi:hypothetical protein
MTAEEKARLAIDAKLTASGSTVQTKDTINLSAARGVAICELSFATGEPDYTLHVDGKPIANPKNRHKRQESERFKSFTYHELLKRDKVNLDIFWLKDEALEESA